MEPVTEITGSRVAAAVPVFLRGKYGLVGTVILARSTSSLNDDVIRLWVILGTIAVIAMIGAALLAFGLARWVSRPLAGLDAAAGWPTAPWTSGPWSIPGPRSCAAWPRRSTPWPDAWKPWCTGTGP